MSGYLHFQSFSCFSLQLKASNGAVLDKESRPLLVAFLICQYGLPFPIVTNETFKTLVGGEGSIFGLETIRGRIFDGLGTKLNATVREDHTTKNYDAWKEF